MTPTVPELQVSDTALARIAAWTAVTTPGVARLQPALTRIMHRAATGALHGQIPSSTAGPADLAAVTIDHPPGPVVVTVRVIATGDPPVLATASALQQRIQDALFNLAAQPADVRIHVTALDPASGGSGHPPT